MRYKNNVLSSLGLILATIGAEAPAALLQPATLHFEFDGGFLMYIAPDVAIVEPQPVVGAMTLTIPLLAPNGPYPGTAEMNSVVPFFGNPWSASGDITGYQNIAGGGAPAYCGSSAMCADAEMTFEWNNNVIPIDASFSLEPSTAIEFANPVDSILTSWDDGNTVYFDVDSIDVDQDGIPGTMMTSGPFVGVTPYFFGQATLSMVCLEPLGLLPEACTTMPAGLDEPPQLVFPEVEVVPLPAGVWLLGSGLIGLIGFARRKR